MIPLIAGILGRRIAGQAIKTGAKKAAPVAKALYKRYKGSVKADALREHGQTLRKLVSDRGADMEKTSARMMGKAAEAAKGMARRFDK